LGYGYWNGTQIKSYAEKSEKMSKQIKEWGKITDKAESVEEGKTAINKIKSESEVNLQELNKTKAPAKAKELESNLKEYFTLSKDLAGEMEAAVGWVEDIEKIGEDLSKIFSTDSSSPESLVTSLKNAKKEVDDSLKKMKSMEAPKGLEEQNKIMKEILEGLSELLGKSITAVEAGDYEGMVSLSTDFESVFGKMATVESPEEALNKTYKEDSEKLDNLEKKIDEQVKNLKNLGQFVF